MTTITQEAVTINDVNKSAILSTMASELFHKGLNPRLALITATAYVGALEYMEEEDMFIEAFIDGLEITSLEIKGMDTPDDEMNINQLVEALIQAQYITCIIGDEVEHTVGPRMKELLELRTEAYAPALATDGITRRFGYAPTKYSALFKEAIHALEDTKYTVDDHMLSVALQVLAKSGIEDEEGYVIRGCENMDSNDAYNSEFKGDRRGRMYQASCHGPNGQASDRSRALMDLYGVKMDYNAEDAMELLKHEMSDMVVVKDKSVRAKLVSEAYKEPVDFIIKHQDKHHGVKKCWSFVKAAKILVELHNHINKGGDKPYIGMAFGLDAKCSGPQLGSLLVGDGALAAACGFSMTQIEDAYHRAIASCNKAGFHDLTRDDIKKPFMGIFYGQGWLAFMDPEEVEPEVWNSIHGQDEILGNDLRAKDFHKAITASFGAKMISVRNAMRSYAGKIEGKVSHLLPDGFKVAMNYKKKVNIFGELVTFDTPKYDVFLRNNVESYKFINLQMNTSQVHEDDFVRNGFVNMIQGVDGLVARLIVVHLKRLGAKHIIAVHDCFRVSVHDMGLLQQAIKNTYRDLFGSLKNVATDDLPEGLDILGLYFDGINAVVKQDELYACIDISQFFASGVRRLQKINGERVTHLISALGQSYYFDK